MEIIAPNNQRRISKHGSGPTWVFNTSSLMQLGSEQKMTTPITGILQWGSWEEPDLGGVGWGSSSLHGSTPWDQGQRNKRPMTRKGLSISHTSTQLSNLSLPATKLNCYVFQGRAEDRGRNHWAQF